MKKRILAGVLGLTLLAGIVTLAGAGIAELPQRCVLE